jgi:hypothetical protein
MIFLIISFLKLCEVYKLPSDFLPCDNLKYFYKPYFVFDNDFKIERIEIFERDSKIFSFKVNGEKGFYFSDDLKYFVGVKDNIINFYKDGRILKRINLENFSGGHFSKNNFVAKVKGGIFLINEDKENFYRDLIDLYFLKDGVVEFYRDKILIKSLKGEKILNLPSYIRKIFVSNNILFYGAKNIVYFYDKDADNFNKIEIKGSLTDIFSNDEYIFISFIKNGNSYISIFDLNGNKIYEKEFGKGFISRIYGKENKIYVLKDKEIFEFLMR